MRRIFKNTKDGPQCLYCYNKHKTKVVKKYTKKTKSRMTLIENADKRFSFLVRLMNKEKSNGGHAHTCTCYTCDKVIPFIEAQCGHFIPRGNMCTRFLIDNCRVQCANCNMMLHGNLGVFEERLEKEIPGIVQKLKELGRKVCYYSEPEMHEIINNIQEENREQFRNS